MRSYPAFWAIAACLLGFVLVGSVFIVDQTEYALVLRFGQVTRQIVKPGLNFKMPLVEDVVYLDNRIHNLDPPPAPLTLADKKRLEIDAFARWQIKDPLAFYMSLRTEARAEQQLGNLINGALLDVFGKVPLEDLLTDKRDPIMQSVRDQVNGEITKKLGLSIVDVRIGRADLPRETLDAVFKRMASERQREAAGYRAEGDQKSKLIRSTADAEQAQIISEAQKNAQDTMGDADGQAIAVYAEAAKLDPEFYAFNRSLQAYRNGLPGTGTTFVLSPNSEFFRYFGDEGTHTGKSAAKP